MNGQNKASREDFVKGITHPRKVELANMIFDGKSADEMKEAGYGRVTILEMVRDISKNVEGQEELSIDIPNEEDDSQKKRSSTEEGSATASSASETGNENKGDLKASEDGKVDTVGGNPVGTETGEEDEATKKAREEEKAKADAENFGHGGALPPEDVKTVGGHEVGTKTGEEDSETLKNREEENK